MLGKFCPVTVLNRDTKRSVLSFKTFVPCLNIFIAHIQHGLSSIILPCSLHHPPALSLVFHLATVPPQPQSTLISLLPLSNVSFQDWDWIHQITLLGKFSQGWGRLCLPSRRYGTFFKLSFTVTGALTRTKLIYLFLCLPARVWLALWPRSLFENNATSDFNLYVDACCYFFLYYFSSFLNLIIYVSKTRLSQFYKYHLGRNQLTVIIKVYFSPNVSLLSASRDRFW